MKSFVRCDIIVRCQIIVRVLRDAKLLGGYGEVGVVRLLLWGY